MSLTTSTKIEMAHKCIEFRWIGNPCDGCESTSTSTYSSIIFSFSSFFGPEFEYMLIKILILKIFSFYFLILLSWFKWIQCNFTLGKKEFMNSLLRTFRQYLNSDRTQSWEKNQSAFLDCSHAHKQMNFQLDDILLILEINFLFTEFKHICRRCKWMIEK